MKYIIKQRAIYFVLCTILAKYEMQKKTSKYISMIKIHDRNKHSKYLIEYLYAFNCCVLIILILNSNMKRIQYTFHLKNLNFSHSNQFFHVILSTKNYSWNYLYLNTLKLPLFISVYVISITAFLL